MCVPSLPYHLCQHRPRPLLSGKAGIDCHQGNTAGHFLWMYTTKSYIKPKEGQSSLDIRKNVLLVQQVVDSLIRKVAELQITPSSYP